MINRVNKALTLALLLAMPIWLFDCVLGFWRQGLLEGWFVGALTALGLIQLLMISATLVALVLVGESSPLGAAMERLWAQRNEPNQAGPTYALVVQALGLTGGFGLAFKLNSTFEGIFVTAHYSAALRALSVAFALAIGLIVGRRLASLVSRLRGPKWITPINLLAVIAGLAMVSYALLWWYRDLLFKEVDPWPILAVTGVAVGALTLSLLAHHSRRRPWPALAGSLGFMLVLLLVPGRSPKVAASLSGGLPLATAVARVLRPATDFDKDGISAWLGGGDCAPFDPLSFPGAVDFPDDGIDQDCLGGDLSSKQRATELDPKFSAVKEGDEAQLVVLVSVDALRPDYLGFYGHKTYPTSPKMDAWARGAVVFDNAYTSGPYTTVAIPSMLTGYLMGQMPGYIGSLYDEQIASPRVKLPSEQETLAEMLKEGGYQTGAIVSGFDIVGNDFAQGFDHAQVISKRSEDTADKVTAAARQWLAEHPSGKRFLWLHYFDPHDPYFHDVKPNFGRSPKARYASSIASMDQHLGALLSELAEQPNSLVALVSDHGESLGEKGVYGHGYNLRRHETRIVMAWRGLGLRPRRVQGVSSLVDVAPTLLNSAGQKARPSAGLSLLGLLNGAPEDLDRAVLTESYRRGQHVSVSTVRWRLFYHFEQNRFELYDQRLNPAENINLADSNPEQVAFMREHLLALMNRGGTFVRQGQRVRELIIDKVPEHALLAEPVRFGDAVELIGFELGQGGDAERPLHVATLYLRALRRMKRSWKVAFGMKGPRPMNKDHLPGRNYYPTDQWPVGVIIKDPVILGDMARYPKARWTFTMGFYAGDQRLKPYPGDGLRLTKSETRVVLAKDAWIAPMTWAIERKRKRRAEKLSEKAAAKIKAAAEDKK
ncbi:MAG: sulfatase [Myxococcota bacterium]|nr:sulfatase [Myxococcota bacterium]